MMSVTQFSRSIRTIFTERVNTQKREDLSVCERVKFSLRDTFLSLPHLMVRMRYLVIATVVNSCWYCDFKSAGKNIKDLAITIIFDSLLTITGLISLILSPWTNRVNQFNSTLNEYFLTHSTLIEIAPKLFTKCSCCFNQQTTELFLKII